MPLKPQVLDSQVTIKLTWTDNPRPIPFVPEITSTIRETDNVSDVLNIVQEDQAVTEKLRGSFEIQIARDTESITYRASDVHGSVYAQQFQANSVKNRKGWSHFAQILLSDEERSRLARSVPVIEVHINQDVVSQWLMSQGLDPRTC